jgi:hypothetical protein
MTEKQAKKQLKKMLDDFTPGTILHFLGEIFKKSAERETDPVAAQRCKNVECALFVVGLGVDAACPQ